MRAAHALAVFSLVITACNRGESLVIAGQGPVRVAADADRVRAIISTERDLQIKEQASLTEAERKRRAVADGQAVLPGERPEPPRRREFLEALRSAPGFEVTSPADALIVESIPTCRCSLRESLGNYMIKIRITSGPLAGRAGWVCDDQVNRTKTPL